VRHARMPGRMAPAAIPTAKPGAPEEARRWPAGLRLIFVIAAALLCWAAVLICGWWLFS
jgi:hypothetical protein